MCIYRFLELNMNRDLIVTKLTNLIRRYVYELIKQTVLIFHLISKQEKVSVLIIGLNFWPQQPLPVAVD